MQNFDEIRPYNDDEVPAAIQRVISNVYFPWLVNTLSPEKNLNDVKQSFLKIKTVQQFQEQITFAVLKKVIDRTISSFTCEGGENLSKTTPYLFISNHRDIILDAALLNVYLFKCGILQTENTFGSNLMKNEISGDLGKLNRMFRINRSGNLRDLYKNYVEVSSYIRHVINDKNRPVWIAQRNGRTKNGDDKTEAAVLKMFAMSSDEPFVDNLDNLNITPISVSYEYEPCVFMKAAELFVSTFSKYVKDPNEDYESILNGIISPKGHVNFAITKPITREELEECDAMDKNDKFTHLANIIDRRIYDAYILEKNNYMAYDMLHKGDKFADHYNEGDKKLFLDYISEGIEKLDTPKSRCDIESIIFSIYANPVKNKLQI